MHEQLLRGVANAGTRGLRIHDDVFRHRQIGGAICINETYTLIVFDHGDRAVLRHEADETFAAAWDDAMHQGIELQ